MGNITPITYEEASRLLEKSRAAIDKAVARKDLSKYPSTEFKQYLIKEQVLLFKGKHIRKSSLSDDERGLWYNYDSAVKNNMLHENSIPNADISSQTEGDSLDLSEEANREAIELARNVSTQAVMLGRAFRENFLAGVAGKMPEEIVSMEKKSPFGNSARVNLAS